jgi:hypothetical protein
MWVRRRPRSRVALRVHIDIPAGVDDGSPARRVVADDVGELRQSFGLETFQHQTRETFELLLGSLQGWAASFGTFTPSEAARPDQSRGWSGADGGSNRSRRATASTRTQLFGRA